MARNRRSQSTAEDRKRPRLGCGMMLAALLVISGCGVPVDGDKDDSTSSSAAASADEAKTITVDDYVGMGLQAAQDAAQEDGIIRLDSTDASGRNRQQLWDRNWTVCAQSPAAGASMSADDTLTFDTVKSSAGETCDDPGGTQASDDDGDSSGASGDESAPAVSGTDGESGDEGSAAVAGTGEDRGGDASGGGSNVSTGGSDSSDDDSGSSSSSGGSQDETPVGATAQCRDGSFSYSAHRRGTCSHHGGVAVWLASVPS
ncbi:DUF3761 domain-containing protein [Streptomyces sp. NPDC018057]|uniref:DUF3761 domain-containing protein n=1 Tax=unclassified Streptomyces TaxID=2593676 RepID=UPI0037923933